MLCKIKWEGCYSLSIRVCKVPSWHATKRGIIAVKVWWSKACSTFCPLQYLRDCRTSYLRPFIKRLYKNLCISRDRNLHKLINVFVSIVVGSSSYSYGCLQNVGCYPGFHEVQPCRLHQLFLVSRWTLSRDLISAVLITHVLTFSFAALYGFEFGWTVGSSAGSQILWETVRKLECLLKPEVADYLSGKQYGLIEVGHFHF